jgi:proteasome accessory factor B
LAETCAVSRRTIYRDLAILEAAGIDVVYQPGRQGYQLACDGWLQPTQLDDHEALALLIVSRLECTGVPFGLMRHVRSGIAKVLQTLPEDLRVPIAASSELIPDEPATITPDPDRHSIHERILCALSQRRRLSIWYRDDVLSPPRGTRLSLYRLARIGGQWSLVGHSGADRQVRVFPVPSIERIELTDEFYAIPPRFRLEKYLEKPNGAAKLPRHVVHLRFTRSAAGAVRDVPCRPAQRLCAGPNGSIDLFLSDADLDDIVLWVISFGDQVEVIEPEQLRRAVRDLAIRITQIHSN